MEQLLHDCRILIESLPEKIKKSAFKTQSIIKMSGIPSATFYNRLKYKNFTLDEAQRVVQILEFGNKIESEIKIGESDISNDRTMSYEELKAKYS